MGNRVSATEARIHFGQLMERVAELEETVIVERSGKPQVVILSVREYDRLSAGRKEEDDWLVLADRSRARIQEESDGRRLPPAEELIGQMREERDAQLMDVR